MTTTLIVIALFAAVVLLIYCCARLMRWIDRIELDPPEWMK